MTQMRWTVRRGVAAGIGVLICLALSLASAGAQGVTPTSEWANFYSRNASFAGVPLPVGSYVAVFDPQGVQCGERTTMTAGYLSPMMPCYGDDDFTAPDEGAVDNDLLTFTVNGSAAVVSAVQLDFSPVDPGTPVRWHNMDVWEVRLVVPPQPLVTIAHEPGLTRLTWQPGSAAVGHYEVWRSTDYACFPGAGGVEQQGTVAADAPLVWTQTAGAGDPAVNYTFRVVSLNAAGVVVGMSQAVAEFDFALTR